MGEEVRLLHPHVGLSGGRGKMAERVRIAFIGCGANSRGHIRSVMSIPEAEVVAICDVNPAAMNDITDKIPGAASLPCFSDYRVMIDTIKPDGVVISIPHALHEETVAHALAAGVHVEVEKPMVVNAEQARRLIELRDRYRRVLLVGYQRHYLGPYRWVRDVLSSGLYGPIHFIECWLAQDWKGAGWRSVRALSGGGELADSGSHLVDAVFWMSGLVPEEVFALIDCRGREVDVLSAITFRCEGGALGTMAIVGEHPIRMDEGMHFWCRDACITVEGSVWGARQPRVTVQRKGEDPQAVLPEDMKAFPGSKDQNFVRAIQGGEEVQAPAECGLVAALFTDAVYASVDAGQPVRVQASTR